MIAKVVPAVRLPVKAGECFDYQVPSFLAPAIRRGSVVVVPFAGRKIGGLVTAVEGVSSHDKPLKEIIGLAQGLSPLPGYVVDLWTKLAGMFATTLPRFVWMALPAIPARAITYVVPSEINVTSERTSGVQSGLDSRLRGNDKEDKGMTNSFVFINSASDTLNTIKAAFAKSSGRQVLFLVPTVDEAMVWSKVLSSALIFHSSLAIGAKYNLACAAANGTAKIVIGTKSAAFLPFGHLGKIIVLNAGSSSHLQEDQDPRFDARVIAEELARATGSELTAIDALPPLGMTPDGTSNRWQFGNEPRVFESVIHDLHDAAKAMKARVLVSDALETAIDETIGNGGRVLIILNRRGVGTAYVCKDCGTMVNCPNCSIPLTAHHDRMSCPACEHLYPLPDSCAKCNGINLKAIGSGSKTLFDTLKKRYPLATILHIDRDSSEKKLDAAQIVVGTTAVFGSLGINPKPFDLAADALMGAGQANAGIWSTESVARILRSLASLLKPDGKLHIQTFDQTAPALRALKDPLGFLKTELEERVAFGYPPAKTLITLYGASVEEFSLLKEAIGLVAILRSKYPAATVGDPQWSRPKLFRGKFRLTIAIKAPHGQDHRDLVQYLPKGFSAEVKTF